MKGREFGSGEPTRWNAESLMAVVSGGRRSEIVQTLIPGPKDVSTIAQELELAMNSVSHNLAILRRFRLVVAQVVGLRHVYQLCECVQARLDDNAVHIRVMLGPNDWIEIRRSIQPGARAGSR